MKPGRPALSRERLREIWCELLGLHQVGDADSFFMLSGKSTDAVRLVNRIEKVFGLEITVRTLFEAPTVDQLMEVLQTAPLAPDRPRLTGGRRSE